MALLSYLCSALRRGPEGTLADQKTVALNSIADVVDSRPAQGMPRLMLTAPGPPCPFRCSYCFANFSDYATPDSIESLRQRLDTLPLDSIIYPACDVDLFARRDAVDLLGDILSWRRHISVSTKARLSRRTLVSLKEMAEQARQQHTVLKIGVSIAATTSLRRIEPNAPAFTERLRTLRCLVEAGVETALLLRPLLVDVPFSEIDELLRTCRELTNRVLIGEEYVDPEEARSLMPGAASDTVIRHQTPSWAPAQVHWRQRTSPTRLQRATDVALNLDYSVCGNDQELIGLIIGTVGLRGGQ